MHTETTPWRWHGEAGPGTDPAGIHQALSDLEHPCFIVRTPSGIGAVAGGQATSGPGLPLLAAAAPLPPRSLGSPAFLTAHGVSHAYMAGAMAGGIASADLVIALAREGFLASYGAAGLLPETIEKALTRFAAEIPGLPYAVNLIHSPSEERLEREAVELFLRHGVRCVEASAFMNLSPHVVRYRLTGLRRDPSSGAVVADHRLIAKISRPETAERFMRPAPATLVRALLDQGLISAEQAELAKYVPMADDITVEGDSGGHTDRRPLTALLPTILRLRDTVQREHRYPTPVRVGAAGGLGCPSSVAAAFAMGAAYAVTGSVNQSCVESGASRATKALLADTGIADCEMAPAADMFEMGVELQVLKKGTLFPMRAKRLYELYQRYDGLEALPDTERKKLEDQIFRRPLEDVWQECVGYFRRRDPEQLARAADHPKRRMALVFRWYLGMASRWSTVGDPDRVLDYQVWCGPAMGAFNDWVTASYLKAPGNRRVADIAHHLMRGAAFHTRLAQLRLAGVRIPASAADYRPVPLESPSLEGAR
ncbi:2-nitropropane dioxygenase [Streptomyces viridochromogenes]|uniref:2-nitropropane dioxygenase n=1 Tax=Streptomyces viridochromogenes TaxID=1938 RepID=A0A0J7YZ13_STRVR|nr:PfaD family polyunsaturated fatty acid/polyketide biosynthesis protein [Streptomyces viridochromogenes]KMS68667.1 2-nitropropane dioxygenase [Streptomyces viridochromogenes]KOG11508.1 2-nitropropane dioxygenase [Streptomyces viridochromogenes]KOG11551.1 2-nitropropane dioxygenase [Streptomyces viridochromogenes]